MAAEIPGTFISEERFVARTKRARLDVEVGIRILSGAIRSWYTNGDGVKEWTLFTEWNVIGHN